MSPPIEQDSLNQSIGLFVTYFIFFAQVTFMLVIMLNFMIAIIDSTYKRVMSQKKIHIYKNKAELNEESYQILKYFTTLKEYNVIVISACKDYE